MASVKNQTMGKIPFIIFLALISSGGPIANDVFLPALPDMPQALGEPVAIVNLILTAYFFAQAIGMLLIGPFADRYGRKKPVGLCLMLYILGSSVCAFSSNVWIIIGARVVQGFGGGAMVSLATALVKDCFDGEDRQNALIAIQAITSVAPLAAPILGSFLLMFTDWRGTFIAQALIGLCALPLYLRTQETLQKDQTTKSGTLSIFKGFGSILKNTPLVFFILGASLAGATMLAYVTAASYIYIDFFQLPKMGYSLFFSANAAIGVLLTMLVPKILKKVSQKRLVGATFCITPFISAAFLFSADVSPYVFSFYIIFLVSMVGAVRPVAVNLIMGMHDGDTGSLASLINFAFAMLGCLGSLLISQPWPTYIVGVGVISLVAALGSLIIWLGLTKKGRI